MIKKHFFNGDNKYKLLFVEKTKLTIALIYNNWTDFIEAKPCKGVILEVVSFNT